MQAQAIAKNVLLVQRHVERHLVCGVLFVLLLLSLTAQAVQERALVGDGETVALKPHLSYFIPDQPLSISEVSRPELRHKFKTLTAPVTDLDRWVWYRFSVERAQGSVEDLFLNFNESLYDELAVFYPLNGVWQIYKGGLNFPYSERPVAARELVFPLLISEGGQAEIYFRIKNFTIALFNPVVQSGSAYYQDSVANNNFTMFSIGLIVGIILYVVSITFLVREKKSLIACILFFLSTVLMVVYYNGYIFPYMNNFPYLQRPFYVVIFSSMTFFGAGFVWSILASNNIFPRMRILLQWFLISFLCFPVFAVLGYTREISIPLELVNILLSLFLFFFAAYAAYKKVVSGRLYFLAIFFYFILQSIIVMTVYGFYEYSFLTRHYFELATLSLGLFVSIAVTNSLYRVRVYQDALAQSAKVAEAKDQAKSEFLAAMSHEIRTPINGVLGMAQMLQRTSLDNVQRYYSDVIISAGKTLLNIINDVLDFSKIEAGKLDVEHAEFNFGEMIAHVAVIFSSSSQEKDINFEILSDPAIPTWLYGDSVRVQQLINNLLSNAFKFTEHGTIDLSVQVHQWVDPSRVQLKFSVQDTGIGISDELKERLFTPYAQADKSTTRKFGGTGLGLSICKQLVTLMGGEIGVQSTPDGGSCFWFLIDFDVVEERQRELLKSRSDLTGKSVALVLSGAGSHRVITDHLLEWGMDVQSVDMSLLPDELDYDRYDVLMLSSSSRQPFQQWLEQAGKHDTPVLLFNPINASQFEGEKYQAEKIKFLKMPASLTQLQNSLLELLGMLEHPSEKLAHTDPNKLEGLAELSILVAEDNMVNLKVIQALLKSLDIEAEFVLDGKAAVEKYCSAPERYNVILMDCEMPNMDGFEASKQIRAFEGQLQTQPVNICALTAHAMDDIANRCRAAGMDDVLIKPVDLGALVKQLQAYSRRLHA